MEIKKNDCFTVSIEDMSEDGSGIGKLDGYIWFIKDAVKGDVDNGLIFCGGRVGNIGRLQTVKDVIEELGINVSQ